jgi:signal transduction histidine kinase
MNPTKTSKSATRLQAEFIRGLSKSTEVKDVLGKLVRETRDLLEAGTCTIFLVDPGRRRATQAASAGYQTEHTGKNDVGVVAPSEVEDQPRPGSELGLTGWMLSTGMPLLAGSADEVRGHPHYAGRPQSSAGDIQLRSFIGVPFRGLYGEVIGVIKAERALPAEGEASDPVGPFSPQDQLILETMARVAARCVIYLDMSRGSPHADIATAWSRDVIAEAAAVEGELDSFLHTAANVAAAAMGADSCGIFLRDEAGQTLTQRAGTGSQALRKVIRSYPWPEPSLIRDCNSPLTCFPPSCPEARQRPPSKRVGLTAWIAATGKSFHARNYNELKQHCHHRGEFDHVNFPSDEVCGAFLGIPLRVGGAVIGAIKVENRTKVGEGDERDFPEEAQRRFRVIAEDIALAMRRLQEQIPVRYDIIEKAKDTIFKILRGGLGIEDLTRTVVEETSALFNAGACALFLKHDDELVQPRWAAAGWAQRGPDVRKYKLVDRRSIKPKPSQEERVGLTVWIAAMQEKFKARSHEELTMHPHHKGAFDSVNFLGRDRCESFMGAPLVIREANKTELVGVLKVETKTRGDGDEKTFTYFSELDEIVFDLIVNSAAVAIQNARLRESEARATENAWRQFTAMAAHRIAAASNSGGTALSDLRKMLIVSPGTSAEIAVLTRMDEALRRIDNLVEEFTEFTKPRMHSVAAVDLNRLCRDAVVGLSDIHVHLKLDHAMPIWWGDEEDIQYCLKEMVLNAAKELKPGGSLTIITSTRLEQGWIRIEFIDDGGGVKPEHKERIFEPAFRDRKGGTGLGLAIVRRIVEQHKGSVREQGIYQKGAHFVIDLPVKAPEVGRSKQILLVDDDTESCETMTAGILAGASDRQVLVARNEHEAGRLIDERAFDLIITDINLSESGGTETGGIKVMERERASGRNTPIIVVTGYGKSEITSGDGPNALRISVEDRAAQLGCFAFLPRNRNTRDVLISTMKHLFEIPGSPPVTQQVTDHEGRS